jgi:hypothetical protein
MAATGLGMLSARVLPQGTPATSSVRLYDWRFSLIALGKTRNKNTQKSAFLSQLAVRFLEFRVVFAVQRAKTFASGNNRRVMPNPLF